MPKILSEKYIVDLSKTSDLEEVGREGFERKKIVEAGFKSPKMLFVLNSAFENFISHLGLQNELKRHNFDDIQNLKDQILSKDIPTEILDPIIDFYKSWKLDWETILAEVRLANVDYRRYYLEHLKSVVLTQSEDLISEIKRAWIDAIDSDLYKNTVQVTEVLPYEVSGFIYVNKENSQIEVNSLFGLWFNDEAVSYYDVCIANLETLEIQKYHVSRQEEMMVKSGKKITNVEVGSAWQKSNKISDIQLKSILKKSKQLSFLLGKSLDISFGIYKNEVYVHDVKVLKDSEDFEETYSFADDFFNSEDVNSFKNEAEAISSLELPFFLREDLQTIESSIQKTSQKGLLVNRLKDGISLSSQKKDEYLKINTPPELLSKESKYLGFLIDYEILLTLSNTIQKASPDKVYNILKQNLVSIEHYFNNIESIEKEAILKLSKLDNKSESDARTHYFTKTLDLLPLRKIGFEILLFKRLTENKPYNFLSLALPQLRSFEELEFVLSILDLSKEESIVKNRSKLYVDLTIPSMLFEYSQNTIPQRYLLDGIIINFNEFMQNFFDKKVFSKRDFELGSKYLKANLESPRNKIKNLMIIAKENEKDVVASLEPDLLIHSD